jgi:hypothetical protein
MTVQETGRFMREHQIVVNLKAEQFEQLQKLARERGFKSVSAYVKQKLLELAMGIEEQAEEAAAPRELSSQVLEDLERIHGELRGFIGELADSSSTQMEAFQTQQPASAPGHTLQSGPSQHASLGPTAASQPSARQASGLLDVEPPDEMMDWERESDSSSSLPTGVSAMDQAARSGSEDPPPPQVLPSRNLGGFGFGIGSRFSSFTPGGFLGGDRLDGYREIMDDMEELADRAFAISPRLGSLDENAETEDEDQDPDKDQQSSRSRGRRKVADETSQSTEAGAQPTKANAAGRSGDSQSNPLNASLDQPAADDFTPSFVEPISLDKLAGPEELESGPTSYDPWDDPEEGYIAGSEGGFPAPLMPPPPEEDDTPSEPNYLPPPAPLPAKDIKEETDAESQVIAAEAVAPVEDDLLSDLLDESLLAMAQTPRDDKDNPFITGFSVAEVLAEVSQASEAANAGAEVTDDLAAVAEAKLDSASADSGAPLQSPSVAETDDNQGKGDGSDPAFAQSETKSAQSDSGSFDASGSQDANKGPGSVTQDVNSMGVSSFRGNPPPKRRRT